MTKPQPPRGTQDLLPPVSQAFEAHEERARALFEPAGYRRIITPMFEDTEVFARGVGEGSDIVAKEMYTFTDRSENSLTLRPEGTAPVIRAVITHSLWDGGLPIKLWYSAAMFRYDRPQKGRFRQHHQIGIEAIGTEDPAIDAEVIALGGELLALAGVTQTSLLLNSIGHPAPDCRDAYRPALVAFLKAHQGELDEDCRRRMDTNPLRVFDCKNPHDQKLLETAPATTLDCLVVGLSAEEKATAFSLTWSLRRRGLAADLAYGERSLKAHLKQADRLGARYAALIGANERSAGACTMRDMTSGEQTQVPLSDAPGWLAERLA